MAESTDIVSLLDYLDIAWRRKWRIAIPTLVFVLAVGVVSWLLPSEWEIETLIQPGKFIVQIGEGRLEEVLLVNPAQLASQIDEAAYNQRIAADLKIDPRLFPRVRAEHLRDTDLVKVALRERDIDTGKAILNLMFEFLKEDLDRKADVEAKRIDTEIEIKTHRGREHEINVKNLENQIASKTLDIQSLGIDKARKQAEIEADRKRLVISEDRAKSILEEMKAVRTRSEDIDARLLEALSQNRAGAEAVGLLLYSNEVQQSLRYLNTLDESLSRERIAQEDLRQAIQDNTEQIRQLDTRISQVQTQIATDHNEIARANSFMATLRSEIALMNKQKSRIDYTALVKPPTESRNPVSPNRMLNVVAAGMIGLMVFTILAFLAEFMDHRRRTVGRSSAGS